MASPGSVLIVVQNLPVPFDRRVWLEAKTLQGAGYKVAVICPKGKHGKFQESYQFLEGIHIYRYAGSTRSRYCPWLLVRIHLLLADDGLVVSARVATTWV